MNIITTAYSQLTINDLYKILQLRSEIFVVEQDCVYNDLDGNDEQAFHFYIKDGANVVAYARVLPPNTRFSKASIGRLVVHKAYRFKGLARQLMNASASWAFKQWPIDTIYISAQKYLKGFYKSVGYKVISDEYLEDGIPHIKMSLSKTDMPQ